MSRRQTTIRICLLILAIAGLGWFAAERVSFDTDPLELLPEDLPEATGLKLFQTRFGKDIDLMIVIEGEDPEQVTSAAASLTEHLLAKPGLVADAYWRPPDNDVATTTAGDFNPLNFAELIAYGWMNAPPDSWDPLLDQLSQENSRDSLSEAFETMAYGQIIDPELSVFRASTDPLGIVHSLPDFSDLLSPGEDRDMFRAQEGRVRLVRAEAPNDIGNYKRTIAWLAEVEPEIRAWQAAESPEIQDLAVDWTGRAPYTAEIASAMEREMKWSVATAILLIHTLFFLFYRRLMPIVWLVLCLALTFTITLTLGSFLFEDLGATSVGFAAILIGLAVDYGFVIYQESLRHGTDPRSLRRKLAYSIGWASVTTAAVFIGLRLSSLPGAAQLGTMVGIGITVGAVVMLTIFTWLNHLSPPEPVPERASTPETPLRKRAEGLVTLAALVFAAVVLALGGLPSISASADDLKPKESHASDVFTEIWTKFGWGSKGGIRVVFSGESEAEVGERVRQAREILEADRQAGSMQRAVQLPPAVLLANTDHQAANRAKLDQVLALRQQIRKDAFEIERPDNIDPEHVEDMLALSSGIFSAWESFAAAPEGQPLLAVEPASRWVLDSIVSREPLPVCALGSIELPLRSADTDAEELRLAALLTDNTDGIFPAGWYLLRPAIVRIIDHEVYWVVLPMAAVLLVMLWLAFRRLRRVALSLAALAFSTLVLLATMSLLNLLPGFTLQWNLMNLAAIPLLLGAGLDYSIHMQLALRRLAGDTVEARRTIGRALVLCGLSTATGFGTLIWSTNAGLASLGLVCTIGILVTMLTCVFLLPAWYRWTHSS